MPTRVHYYTPIETLGQDMDNAVYMLTFKDEVGELTELDHEILLHDLMGDILNCGVDPQTVDFAVSIVTNTNEPSEVRIILRSAAERITASFCRHRIIPPVRLSVGRGDRPTALAWLHNEPPFCHDGSYVSCFDTYGSFDAPLSENSLLINEDVHYERSN